MQLYSSDIILFSPAEEELIHSLPCQILQYLFIYIGYSIHGQVQVSQACQGGHSQGEGGQLVAGHVQRVQGGGDGG